MNQPPQPPQPPEVPWETRRSLHNAIRALNPAWGTSVLFQIAESAAESFLQTMLMYGWRLDDAAITHAARFANAMLQGVYDMELPAGIDKDAPWSG